ncbi:MAG: thiamine diphosphokinase [Eubacteriales bacterium]|nr:thiamine diphosphokinase [Eubacteriales bacterium]
MRTLIVASAPEEDDTYIKALAERADFIMCADGGTRHAAACGIAPDLVVGDFDSGHRPESGVATITLQPEKDDSDLMSCTKEAIRRGASCIDYACASGGRIDHFLSNLSLLEYLFQQGKRGVFYDNQNRVTFHGGGTLRYMADAAYRYVGIIPLDAELRGVTLTGLKYPLQDVTVARSEIITISNEAITPEYTISIREGRALVIESKDK